MPANKIMLIRHAEKPDQEDNSGKVRGVTSAGEQDKEELIVRGWQRSGALVRFFAPRNGTFIDPRLLQPKTIFASAVAKHSESLRPQHTVLELVTDLKAKDPTVKFDLRFPKGAESDLAEAAALKADGPVLIAWEHEAIPTIVNGIVGDTKTCPQKWDGARFDMVWVLDRKTTGNGWVFSQVPQLLLPGDSAHPIA
jgi:hypothetical protein